MVKLCAILWWSDPGVLGLLSSFLCVSQTVSRIAAGWSDGSPVWLPGGNLGNTGLNKTSFFGFSQGWKLHSMRVDGRPRRHSTHLVLKIINILVLSIVKSFYLSSTNRDCQYCHFCFYVLFVAVKCPVAIRMTSIKASPSCHRSVVQ